MAAAPLKQEHSAEEAMADRFSDEDRLRRLIDLMSSGNLTARRKALGRLRLAYRNGDRAKRRFIVSLLYHAPVQRAVDSGMPSVAPRPHAAMDEGKGRKQGGIQ